MKILMVVVRAKAVTVKTLIHNPMTSYISKAIEKAIEGQYSKDGHKVGLSENYGAYVADNIGRDGNTTGGHLLRNEEIFLDSLFWQSLGKAMGWDMSEGAEMITIEKESNHDVHFRRIPESTARWHLFIEHIAEGKDAESFFAEIMSDKKTK
jgi:hypothetical protein